MGLGEFETDILNLSAKLVLMLPPPVYENNGDIFVLVLFFLLTDFKANDLLVLFLSE